MPSQAKATKASGVCSHCLSSRQLHLRDGRVHQHGPRSSPCPGSNLPPLGPGSGLGTATGFDMPDVYVDALDSLTPVVAAPASLAPNTVDAPSGSSMQSEPGIPAFPFPYSVCQGPTLKLICKGARASCSQALVSILRGICTTPDSSDVWRALLGFAPFILAKPPRAGHRRSLANIIKGRVESWVRDPAGCCIDEPSRPICDGRPRRSDALITAVNSKLEDGNIRAAVRILCEQSSPAIPNAHNLDILREKHPVDPCPSKLLELPDPASTNPLQVTEPEVLEALRSLPAGAAGAPGGFRPSHLLDLLSHGETAPALISALTDFSNLLLRGGAVLKRSGQSSLAET